MVVRKMRRTRTEETVVSAAEWPAPAPRPHGWASQHCLLTRWMSVIGVAARLRFWVTDKVVAWFRTLGPNMLGAPVT